jgi:hypothetical protein
LKYGSEVWVRGEKGENRFLSAETRCLIAGKECTREDRITDVA